MNTAQKLLNDLTGWLFALLLWPFRSLDPFWGLLVVSLVAGLFMLWVYGRVSNQEGIRQVKNRVRGNLLGVRLYQHDIGVVLRLQGTILRDTLVYMRYSLLPLLVILIPLLLMLAQTNRYFSLRPLRPGETAVVTVRLADASLLSGNLRLDAGAVAAADTPAVRVPAGREVAWRIRAASPGCEWMTIGIGNLESKKEICVGQGWGAIAPLRSGSWTDLLLYPGEAPLDPSQPVQRIEVQYRTLDVEVFGWQIHWLLLFFLISMASAFAFKGVFEVEL